MIQLKLRKKKTQENQMIKMTEFDKHEMSIAPGFPLRKIQILNHTKI